MIAIGVGWPPLVGSCSIYEPFDLWLVKGCYWSLSNVSVSYPITPKWPYWEIL